MECQEAKQQFKPAGQVGSVGTQQKLQRGEYLVVFVDILFKAQPQTAIRSRERQ